VICSGELPGKKLEAPSKKVRIDVRLDEIVLRALEKKPERRYQQVSVLKTQVETIAENPDSGRRRGDEVQTEKPAAKADQSESLLTSFPTNQEARFSRWIPMAVFLLLFTPMMLWMAFGPARKTHWIYILCLVYLIGYAGYLLVSNRRRSKAEALKRKAGLPVETPARIGMKHPGILLVLYAGILLVNLFQWWSKYEPAGVWFPNPLDASVSGEYGEALVHVTNVSQVGQVVLITLACDTAYPERGLYVQYSGQLFDYAAAIIPPATNLDCLVAPRFNNGEDRVLAGTTLLKGKPIYRIGFVLPDVDAATKVVEQVKQIHLGKPRGLDQNGCVLHLFEMHRRVGEKSNGQPVTENLAGILVWQPKRDDIAKTKPASTPKLAFGPVVERVVQLMSPEATNLFLRLQTGEFLSPPQTHAPRFFFAWMTNNVNLTLDQWTDERGFSRFGLTVFNTKLSDYPSDDWDTATPEAIEAALTRGTSLQHPQNRELSNYTYLLPVVPRLPLLAFTTTDGAQGLLQITGFTEHPRGVKIRYKLAQNDSGLRKQAVQEAPPSFDFQFRRDGGANGGKTLVEFRMIREGGVAKNISLKPESGIEGDIERQESTPEHDFYSVIFNSERGLLPPVWNFSIIYTDKNQRKIKQTYAVVIHSDVAPPGHFEVRLADESYRTNMPDFNFTVRGVGPRSAALVMTRMGKPVTHFKMQSPPGVEGHFNNLQTTVNYDQQELVFNAQTNGLPEKWKFSIEFLAADLDFHRHFFEVTYQPTNKWENRLMVKEVPERIVRNTEVPKLQFLAWQDAWQTNQPGAARHPDGSPVTEAAEICWLKVVLPGRVDVSSYKLNPEPRFLHFWFSHPAFTRNDFSEITLLDGQGRPLKLGADGSSAGGNESADESNSNQGWKLWTLSPSETTNIPSQVTVRLRYTLGPLERTQEVKSDYNGMMSLEGGSQLNGIGQNKAGRAFVAVAVDAKNMRSRVFDVVAVTKDGREIPRTGWERGGTIGAGVSVENFDFEIPLADVAKFIIGTRPIRTNEWKNVGLPKN